jgi:hypothetical protein
MLERVAEPVMAAVAVETHTQPEREAFPGVMNSSHAADSMAGAPVFDQATFGEPESLEPPSRPVWELGLPDPIHQVSRPIEAARSAPPPASASPQMPKVSLVSAFSALLAAEQSSGPAVSQAAVAGVTEATVEDAVRRVLVRMTDDLVRRIVLETAERLIKEEIEKIKANPE